MLIRTHLAITGFFVLLILPYASDKVIFTAIAVLATFMPDIDSRFSKLGKAKIFRPLQLFLKHRGILHSFIFLAAITIIFAVFVPIIALPFLLGYGLHILADGMTVSGIRPFYPLKANFRGMIKTAGIAENLIFISLIILDFLLLARFFLGTL